MAFDRLKSKLQKAKARIDLYTKLDVTPKRNVRVRDVLREFNQLPITGAKRYLGGVLFEPKEKTPETFKQVARDAPKTLRKNVLKIGRNFGIDPSFSPEERQRRMAAAVIDFVPVGATTKAAGPAKVFGKKAAKKGVEGFKALTTGKPISRLTQEARKYKSADWKLSQKEFIEKYPDVLIKKPSDMQWIEAEKVYVQGKLAQSKEFTAAKEAFRKVDQDPSKGIGTKEWRLAARKVEHLDKEADREVSALLHDAKKGDNAALAKLEEYKSQLTDIWKQASGVTTKERGFISSVKKVIPKAEQVAGQYVPRSTDNLAIRARNYVKDFPNDAERLALTGADDKAVAVASELIKKYGDDATKATDATQANVFYDKAAEIANSIAPKLTEAGRTVQAASILGRLTPEGQLRFAAMEIIRYNRANPKAPLPKLTGVQTKAILEEMKRIQAMPDGVEKAMRFQSLQEGINALFPTPLIKKVTAVWKAGLLTGLKTSGLNIFSNISHASTEIAKDVPATVVDSVASLFTGKRTKTFTTKGLLPGTMEGFEKGFRYFSTGFDERNIAAKLDYKKVNFGKGKVAKAFQVYTDTVFRAMGTADQPFYYGALSRSLHDQALAQAKNAGLRGKEAVQFAEKLVKTPTEEMIRYGVADATTAVFQNKTALGVAASKIQQIPYVGEFALPFGRTPSAVAMQIVNYSPVGIAKTIVENIGKGRFDQRLFAQGLGRSLTGTGVIAIGMALAKKGMVALDYPRGDEREQELQKAEGVKNNAIKIGGKWRSPVVLGPVGNLLLVGAHFQNALETSGSPTEALSKTFLGGLKSFTEQTFLVGINQAVNAIADPERYAKSYLPNLLASFVPTLVSDIARATDPLERRATNTLERVQARIPGVRRKLEPQVDILGRERESVGNPLEILIDPTRPSPDTSTPVTQELRRLMDSGFRVSPTVLGDKQGYEGLTKGQNTQLWKKTGEVLNEKLENLFNDERYQKMPDDKKAKTVERFVEQAKVNVRAAMVLFLTKDLTGDDLREKLSELKKNKVMTREVFNKYSEIR